MIFVLLTESSDYLFPEGNWSLRSIFGSIIYEHELNLMSTPLAFLEVRKSFIHGSRESFLFIVAGVDHSDVIRGLFI